MDKDKALDLALEALEHMLEDAKQERLTVEYWNECVDAITAIKQARSAPVQEPVAYWIPKAEQFCIADPSGRPFAKAWKPLYTTPPAQPAPTQEHQINQLEKFKNHVLANADALGVVLDAPAAPVQEPCQYAVDVAMPEHRCVGKCQYAAQRQWVGLTDDEVIKCTPTWGGTVEDVARAIEAKLKEKNT